MNKNDDLFINKIEGNDERRRNFFDNFSKAPER